MAAEASKSGVSPDSYIGSLISLTSKFEIRYEGILYNINTEESSIGLQNVRSFGTEGRKKDGPQVLASDKIYEYILFRGSDIKDLQVKSSPPAPTVPIHSDPAIIQSHYSHPASASTSLPAAVDTGSSSTQFGNPRASFQGGLPMHQSGGSFGPWGSSPSPPNPNGPGLAMPLYWPQGYYTPSGGLPPHLQQPSFLRPPPALPIPMQQPLQYAALNAAVPSGSLNLSEIPPPLLQPVGSTPSLTSTMLPSTLSHIQASSSVLDTANLPYKPPVTSVYVSPFASNLESVATVSQSQIMPSVVSKPAIVPSVASQTISQSVPLTFGSFPSPDEISAPLVTPETLLQPVLSTFSSSQPLRTIGKVEAKTPEVKMKESLPKPSVLAQSDHKEPLLPLPVRPTGQKPVHTALQTHHGIRGRGRGRGNLYPRQPVTKFEEDFDFMAMNEKFNKDEVWGHLGKSKAQSRDGEGEDDEADDALLEDDGESLNLRTKPVYVKDDFFDSLSSNALDSGSRYGRTKFSERLKMDTETFGDFQSFRGGRGGGRGPPGGRARGSYYGRGYGYGGRAPVRGRTGNRGFEERY